MKYPTTKQLEEIRTRWFKNHVATIAQHTEHLSELKWKQPDSGIYSIKYLLCGGALLVHGDVGEAIYRWGGYGERLTFEWLANCNLDYFHGKCCASERGRDYVRFNAGGFIQNLRDEIAAGELRASSDWDNYVDDISDESEAHAFLNLNFNQCDSETLGSLIEAGRQLELRCAAHLVGIQMAVQQLVPL